MAGLSTLWILEVIPGASMENVALTASAAALGSLLPDLDAAESKIKHLQISGVKPFLLPSQIVYRQLGHRSLLHSLPGLAFIASVGAGLMPIIGWQPAVALWLGYASHLISDGMTKSGIPLLYPRPKRFHLLPKSLRLTTGSAAEDVLFALLSLLVLTFLLGHL
jgi:inner membrane protein